MLDKSEEEKLWFNLSGLLNVLARQTYFIETDPSDVAKSIHSQTLFYQTVGRLSRLQVNGKLATSSLQQSTEHH